MAVLNQLLFEGGGVLYGNEPSPVSTENAKLVSHLHDAEQIERFGICSGC